MLTDLSTGWSSECLSRRDPTRLPQPDPSALLQLLQSVMGLGVPDLRPADPSAKTIRVRGLCWSYYTQFHFQMTELPVLDLVKKGLVTKKVELTIGYDFNGTTCERHRCPADFREQNPGGSTGAA